MRSGVGPGHALRGLGITPHRGSGRGGRKCPGSPGGRGFTSPCALNPKPKSARAPPPIAASAIRQGLANTGFNDMLIASCNVYGIEGDALGAGRGRRVSFPGFSRGRLRISSPDPAVNPVIEEAHALGPSAILSGCGKASGSCLRLAGIPHSRRLLKTCRLGIPQRKSRSIESFATDAQLDQWLMQECADCYHIVGTCRMGAVDDP